MESQKQKIKKVFEKITKNKLIHESVLLIESASGDFSYHLEYGGKKIDSPMLMASITKLFTTTCILILREQEKLSLDDTLVKYLDEDTLNGLHIYKGHEYSSDLTITHLLFHTSGLPDATEEGNHKARKRAIYEDSEISFEETIMKTKQLKTHFKPGMGKRAQYSNVNFDILGKVIENVTHLSLEDVYKQFIFDPLGLKNTYLPSDDDLTPNVYYKDTPYFIPKVIRSIRASGGCISTARELMVFIKAYFKGRLFNHTIFQELGVNNKLQFAMGPIHYSAGYMKIPLGGPATLFMGKGELLGHSGSTGSFAFYYPALDLYFVGDVNQAANSAIPIRLVMQLAMSVYKT